MAHSHPESDPSAIHDHERRDLSVTAILWFFAGLAVTAILIHFLMAGMFEFMERHNVEGATVSPYAAVRQEIPLPHVQVSERMDLRDYREMERVKITNYGWVDKSKGVVRLPIDRALDLIEQRGMPVFPKYVEPAGAAGTTPAPVGASQPQKKP